VGVGLEMGVGGEVATDVAEGPPGTAEGVAACPDDPDAFGAGASGLLGPPIVTCTGGRIPNPPLGSVGLSPPAMPPTATMPRAPMVATPVPSQLPMPDQSPPSVGIWAIHAPMPIVLQRFPEEMLRKARTITGSNCVPATRMSSWRDATTLMGRLYGRGAVMTSYTSATETIRAAREISCPFRWRG
jgi:hypothetical protein